MVKDKELQVLEKESLINELLRSNDFSSKNSEFIRSLQRLASTRGESSYGPSERVSIGNQLKESKLSFNSGGFENSGGRKDKQQLHKFRSETQFMSLEQAQRLQDSQASSKTTSEQEESTAIVNGGLLSSIKNDKKYFFYEEKHS
jgi:hypothetical protein